MSTLRRPRIIFLLQACVILLLLLATCLPFVHGKLFSRDKQDRYRDLKYEDEKRSGMPLWLMVVGGAMLMGGLCMMTCAGLIFAWLYAQYKVVHGYMSVGSFLWDVVGKLRRGQNPFPRNPRTGELEGLDRLPVPGGRLGMYVAQHGIRKAEELFEEFMEKRGSGAGGARGGGGEGYGTRSRARTSSTSSTESE